VFYKPSTPAATDMVIYVFPFAMPSKVNGYPPLNFYNASNIVAQNLAIQGPAWAVVGFVGGHHLTLRNCSIRWGQFAGISTGDVGNLHSTDEKIYYLAPWGGPGTQYVLHLSYIEDQLANHRQPSCHTSTHISRAGTLQS
jgi:hypothetical protein